MNNITRIFESFDDRISTVLENGEQSTPDGGNEVENQLHHNRESTRKQPLGAFPPAPPARDLAKQRTPTNTVSEPASPTTKTEDENRLPRPPSTTALGTSNGESSTTATMLPEHASMLRLQRQLEQAMDLLRQERQTVEETREELQQVKSAREELARHQESVLLERENLKTERDTLVRELDTSGEAVAAQQALVEQLRQDAQVSILKESELQKALRKLESEGFSYRERASSALKEKQHEVERLLNRVKQLEENAASSSSNQSVPIVSSPEYVALLERNKELTSALQASAEQAATNTVAEQLRTELEHQKDRFNITQQKLAEAQHNSDVTQSLLNGEVQSHTKTRERLEKLQKELEAAQKKIVLNPAGGSSSSSASGSSDELERRARDLADLVLEKQTALEAKRAESDQWRTRYEASQCRLREVELLGHVASSSSNNGSDSSSHLRHRAGGRAIFPPNLSDNEGDFESSRFFERMNNRGQWGKKIASTARTIDGLSLTVGRMMRQNSVLRIAVFCYVILLQTWAFFAVAFTSVPQPDTAGSVPASSNGP